MAKITKDVNSFDEQDTNDAKGKKIALIKTVDGMKNLSESEVSEGLRIIDRTSGSKQNKRKRMGNFLNDVTGRNLL